MKLPKVLTGAFGVGGLLTFSDTILKCKRACEKDRAGLKEVFLLEQTLSFFTGIADSTIRNPDDARAKEDALILKQLIVNVSNGVLLPLKAKQPVLDNTSLIQFSNYLKEKAREAKHRRGPQIDLEKFKLDAKLEAERLLKLSVISQQIASQIQSGKLINRFEEQDIKASCEKEVE